MVVRLADRTSELLNMPNNLKEPFITRMMELSNVRRAEFMTRMRRFEVSARAHDGPRIGGIMNISRALEEYIGTRFVPPPWRPYLEFGGSDLEEERFHGPMTVNDCEEAVARQSTIGSGNRTEMPSASSESSSVRQDSEEVCTRAPGTPIDRSIMRPELETPPPPGHQAIPSEFQPSESRIRHLDQPPRERSLDRIQVLQMGSMLCLNSIRILPLISPSNKEHGLSLPNEEMRCLSRSCRSRERCLCQPTS